MAIFAPAESLPSPATLAQDVPKSWSVVLSDTHQVSISQQMSRVIAFDIAVVAQKVKVVNEDRCDLFGGGPLVQNRKGSQSNRKDAD